MKAIFLLGVAASTLLLSGCIETRDRGRYGRSHSSHYGRIEQTRTYNRSYSRGNDRRYDDRGRGGPDVTVHF